MENTVIKVLNKEHGKKVIEWFKSQGADVTNYSGIVNEEDGGTNIYYGIINGEFENYFIEQVLKNNAKIIELPAEEEFDMTTDEGRLAYAKKHYPVGTVIKSMYNEYNDAKLKLTSEPRIYIKSDGSMLASAGPLKVPHIYYKGKWAEIIKEEEKMETNLLELIRLFPELPTDYAKKLVQKVLEVKEGNLINLANFIGSVDTPTPFYEIITGSKSEQKADYVWRKIYDFKNKKMETQRLYRHGLKEIHSVACTNWKEILEKYGTNNPLEDYIELTQAQVDTMFNSCTKEQLPIVSKYLKQDDGSVNLTEYETDNEGFYKGNLYILRSRNMGKYKEQSFSLLKDYNWEIKTDEYGELCLIPTKKQ